MMSATSPKKRSTHHGLMPNGQPGIAIDPYRFNGGLTAVIQLAKAADVAYDAGYPCGAMFIAYPDDPADIETIDELIDQGYAARVD